MASERNETIQAVADAWLNPGISPEYHTEWQARLSAPSEEGGWPVLYRAIMKCVTVAEKRRQA